MTDYPSPDENNIVIQTNLTGSEIADVEVIDELDIPEIPAAHYAYLDENNVVTQIIVGKNEYEDGIDWEIYYGAKRTSYNTYAGKHIKGGIPFRKNYAGIGYTYDEIRDAFIPPKSYDSWILDEETCQWKAPVPYPTDGLMYQWVEDDLNWQAVTLSTE